MSVANQSSYVENIYAESKSKDEDKMISLENIISTHKIWNNPLLMACSNGSIDLTAFKFLFSQYYLYSRNFTKLLAAALVKCDSDYFRSKLSMNLWEEGGGADIEQRHSEIFRNFLKNSLKLDLNKINFEPYTEIFVKEYLALCLDSAPAECVAVLSYGTEAIVSRLYQVMKKGLLSVGFKDEELLFFNIHIACDDEHAETLKEITLSYHQEPLWLERCQQAIIKALDLRDEFFKSVYKTIQSAKTEELLARISSPLRIEKIDIKKSLYQLDALNNPLYKNQDLERNINFTVERIPFDSDVLDPRVVHIPQGFTNESHSHAHETVFLILSGKGEVVIGDKSVAVKSGDSVFVPRWAHHQTKNIGQEDLVFFAVTDYGLTKKIPSNTEECYRLNKNSSN